MERMQSLKHTGIYINHDLTKLQERSKKLQEAKKAAIQNQEVNRPARALQHLHSRENCFLDLSWHLNRPARASKNLHGDENCFLDLSWTKNSLARASQDLMIANNLN